MARGTALPATTTTRAQTRSQPLLSRREAAELAGVSLAAVNKAIEQRVVRTVRGARGGGIPVEEVPVLAVVQRAGMPLPATVKRRIRDWLIASPGASRPRELAISATLVVRCDEEVVRVAEDAAGYARSRAAHIGSDRDVKGGEPVIRGTRLTARAVLARLAGGDTIDDLAADYPDIDREAFGVAATYARAHPRRGRPPRPRIA